MRFTADSTTLIVTRWRLDREGFYFVNPRTGDLLGVVDGIEMSRHESSDLMGKEMIRGVVIKPGGEELAIATSTLDKPLNLRWCIYELHTGAYICSTDWGNVDPVSLIPNSNKLEAIS